MKHTSILLGAVLLAQAITVVGIMPAHAQTATMSVNPGNAVYGALKDFDVLGLDFNIQTVVGDKLNALVIAKQGTAREGFDYIGVDLYADQGVEGLQGWGYDKLLGQATFESGVWVFTNINYTFTKADQRFFVTIRTSDLPQGKTLQFGLLQAGDNGNGVYDAGEQGVFLNSQVIKTVSEPSYSNVIYTSGFKNDVGGPAAFINNVSIDPDHPTQITAPTTEIVFTGEAKDRNGGMVQSVKLLINDQEIVAQATDVDFAKWRAVYVPSQLSESLIIQVAASDGNNVWPTAPYYVDIDARAVEVTKSQVAAMPDHLLMGQSSQISVVLHDNNGATLPNRTVHFSPLRIEDTLSAMDVVTDTNGKATITFTPQSVGTAKVDVRAGEVAIGSVTIIVDALGTPETPDEPEAPYRVGDLIKGSQRAVYYYSSDGMRHVFVNAEIYASWYGTDFSKVKTLSDSMIASIPLGKPVPFKPGTLIKVPSVPDVYVVDVSQLLRHVESEQVAIDLFGSTWNKQVHDLSEALLFTYDFGASIAHATELDKTAFNQLSLTIDSELTQ